MDCPAPLPNLLPRPRRRAAFALALWLGLAGAMTHSVVFAGTGAGPDPDSRQLHARELVEIGIRFEHSEGRTRNFARAHELYCEAAREDSPDAFVRLGWMYANGRGVKRDDSTAHSLFLRAASLGSEVAARLAGVIRSDTQRLPECLTLAPEPPAEPVETAAAEPVGETPVMEFPAQFRPAPTAAEYRKLVAKVVELSREFRLDPRLVFSLIRVESGFDPMARSPKNAQGLMQLIPETAERFAVHDVWDPVENLRGGMSYLRWLLSYFRGDVVLTLAAYNAGEKAVDRFRGVPPYPETVMYVQRIRTFYPLDRHAFDPKVAAGFGPSPALAALTAAVPLLAVLAPATPQLAVLALPAGTASVAARAAKGVRP